MNVRGMWTFADGMFTVLEGWFVVKEESASGLVLPEKEAYNSSIGTIGNCETGSGYDPK